MQGDGFSSPGAFPSSQAGKNEGAGRKPGQWGIREDLLCWWKVGKPCRNPGVCFVASADNSTSRVVLPDAPAPLDRSYEARGWSAEVATGRKPEQCDFLSHRNVLEETAGSCQVAAVGCGSTVAI